jgi:hypothetical protein
MQGRKHMAQQLGCTTIIETTPNNGINVIQFGPHSTWSGISHLTSK